MLTWISNTADALNRVRGVWPWLPFGTNHMTVENECARISHANDARTSHFPFQLVCDAPVRSRVLHIVFACASLETDEIARVMAINFKRI